MRHYLDVEFDGFGGRLVSLALVSEDGRELYLATDCPDPCAWVAQNVMPIVNCRGAEPIWVDLSDFGHAIATFLDDDARPVIIADWPDDIRYFCQCLIVGPGEMVDIPGPLQFQVHRVASYPTALPGAVRHNALWDARALRKVLL